MGSSVSKANEEETPIGYYSSGDPFYEASRQEVESQIRDGTLVEVVDGVDGGWEVAVHMNGKRYMKKKSALQQFGDSWWAQKRPQIVEGVARKLGMAEQKASVLVDVVLPVLIKNNKIAAVEAVRKASLELGNVNVERAVDAVSDEIGSRLANAEGATLFRGAGQHGKRMGVGKKSNSYIGAVEHFFGADKRLKQSDMVVGGCDCKGLFVGSADLDLVSLKTYSDSLNSKAKGKIMSSILEVCEKLGLKSNGATVSDKIRTMVEQLPTGDKFKTSTETQRNICEKIAEAINRTYGSEIINKTLPPSEICQQVSEMMISLAAGMHSEFLAVYNDVRAVLKNLHVLRESLDEDRKELETHIKKSDDTLLAQKTETFMDLHKMLTKEINRQIEMLAGLLNVTLEPADKGLAKLIDSAENVHGVSKIDVKMGTDGFGKLIYNVLKSMGVTANFALIIEKALKTVGMSVSDYEKAASVRNLRETITKELISKNLGTKELKNYLEAAELLYANLYRNKEISEVIKTGSMVDYKGSADSSSGIDSRVKNKRRLKGLIFITFNKQINIIFDNMVAALNVLSSKIGTEIPMTEQLEDFRRSLQRVNTDLIKNKYAYFSLIGYHNDALSRSKKDQLLLQLKNLSGFLKVLIDMPMYKSSAAYFKPIDAAVMSILELIDKFSDDISKKFGSGEIKGGDDLDKIYSMPHVQYKSRNSLADAIRTFDYRYKVSQIKQNMKRASKEMAHYSEKYETLTAAAIAEKLKKSKEWYEKVEKHLNDYSLVNTQHLRDYNDAKKQKDAALRVLKAQWETRKKFWATVEAVDTYMKIFADSVMKNLEDIKDIKSMLDETEIMENWYTPYSGNMLAAVFDHFPNKTLSDGFSDANFCYPPDNYRVPDPSQHYYLKLNEGIKSNTGNEHLAVPGNPLIVLDPVRAEKAEDLLKKTLTNVTVLKNLLSVFVHIGSKFGGEEIHKKVFMTPSQMYNNLVDFMKASAFSKGLDFNRNSEKSSTLPSTLGEGRGFGIVNTMEGNGGTIVYNRSRMRIFNNNSPDSFKIGTAPYYRKGLNVPKNLGSDNVEAFRRIHGTYMSTIYKIVNKHEIIGFSDEHKYFIMIIKSICAKIFTVTGLYDVLDRPHESNSLSTVRLLMGGEDELPQIDEQIVAVYLRLPLLAIFYRDLFKFQDSGGFENLGNKFGKDDQNIKISMVPEMEGIFSNIIRIIFRKNNKSKLEDYSDEDIKELIIECNRIYNELKSKHTTNTVSEIFSDFVAEINSRYGIITKKERNDYETEFGYRYNESSTPDRYSEFLDSDYAYLPGEDEDEIEKPSAAERLLGSKIDTKLDKNKFSIHSAHKKLVRKFRCMIDKQFENTSDEFAFGDAIRTAQKKINSEKDPKERFKIVSNLMRGKDIYSKVDGIKYVMFHETVITGLNTLSGIHTILTNFIKATRKMNVKGLIKVTLDKLETSVGTTMTSAEIIRAWQSYGAPDLNYLLGSDQKARKNGGDSDGIVGMELKPFAGMVYGKHIARSLTSITISNTGDMTVTTTGNVSIWYACFHNKNIITMKRNYYNKKEPHDDKKTIQLFFRMLFDHESFMKEFLNNLMEVSVDLQGLITVGIEDDKVIFNCSKLKSLITETFLHIRKYLDMFSPHLDEKFIEKYVNKFTPGSFYWLQEQLMEKIMIGRPESTTLVDKKEYVSVDKIPKRLSSIYKYLTQKYDFDLSGVNETSMSLNSNESTNTYDKVLSEMIFYDGTRTNSGMVSTTADGWAPIAIDPLSNPYDSLHFSGTGDNRVLDLRFYSRYPLYKWDDYTGNRSILFAFNQIIAKYIQSFYDTTGSKIYAGLVNQFANGVFNRAVSDNLYTYPDTLPCVFITKKHTGDDVNFPPVYKINKYITENEYDNIYQPLVLYMNLALDDVASTIGDKTLTNDNTINTVIRNIKIRATFGIIFSQFRIAPAGNLDNVLNGIASTANIKTLLAGAGGAAVKDVNYISNIATMQNAIAAVIGSPLLDVTNLLYSKTTYQALCLDINTKIYKMAIRAIPSLQISDTEMRSLYSFQFAAMYTAMYLKEINPQKYGDLPNKIEFKPEKQYYLSSEEKLFIKYEELQEISEATNLFPNAREGDRIVYLTLSNEKVHLTPSLTSDQRHKFGRRMDADGEHVLFSSLANILRNICKTRSGPTQNQTYIQENVADIAPYMKEKMRANLPAFKSLFKSLSNRCDFLKMILSQKSLNVTRDYSCCGARSAVPLIYHFPDNNPWPYTLKDGNTTTSSEQTKERWNSILEAIIRGCDAFITSCDQCVKEIGDDPKYAETHQGFIREYKQQNSMDPFMPLSSVLYILKNVDLQNPHQFIPVHSLGEPHFKLMYAMRGIMHNQKINISADAIPGFFNTLENYNLSADEKITDDSGVSFLKNLLPLLRYLYEATQIKPLLCSRFANHHMTANNRSLTPDGIKRYYYVDRGLLTRGFVLNKKTLSGVARGAFSVANQGFKLQSDFSNILLKNSSNVSIVDTDGLKNPEPAGPISTGYAKCVFSISKNLEDSLKMTESSFREKRLKELVHYLLESEVSNKSIVIQNILDLNISPINVHAMMREIPLVNLYNFSYTFDRMVIELYYGAGSVYANNFINSLCSDETPSPYPENSSKDSFVISLLDPYKVRPNADWNKNNFLGGMSIEGLSRPKFISDQLFFKVLFGNLPGTDYSSNANPMGPGANEVSFDKTRDILIRLYIKRLLSNAKFVFFFKTIHNQFITDRNLDLLMDMLENPKNLPLTIESVNRIGNALRGKCPGFDTQICHNGAHTVYPKSSIVVAGPVTASLPGTIITYSLNQGLLTAAAKKIISTSQTSLLGLPNIVTMQELFTFVRANRDIRTVTQSAEKNPLYILDNCRIEVFPAKIVVTDLSSKNTYYPTWIHEFEIFSSRVMGTSVIDTTRAGMVNIPTVISMQTNSKIITRTTSGTKQVTITEETRADKTKKVTEITQSTTSATITAEVKSIFDENNKKLTFCTMYNDAHGNFKNHINYIEDSIESVMPNIAAPLEKMSCGFGPIPIRANECTSRYYYNFLNGAAHFKMLIIGIKKCCILKIYFDDSTTPPKRLEFNLPGKSKFILERDPVFATPTNALGWTVRYATLKQESGRELVTPVKQYVQASVTSYTSAVLTNIINDIRVDFVSAASMKANLGFTRASPTDYIESKLDSYVEQSRSAMSAVKRDLHGTFADIGNLDQKITNELSISDDLYYPMTKGFEDRFVEVYERITNLNIQYVMYIGDIAAVIPSNRIIVNHEMITFIKRRMDILLAMVKRMSVYFDANEEFLNATAAVAPAVAPLVGTSNFIQRVRYTLDDIKITSEKFVQYYLFLRHAVRENKYGPPVTAAQITILQNNLAASDIVRGRLLTALDRLDAFVSPTDIEVQLSNAPVTLAMIQAAKASTTPAGKVEYKLYLNTYYRDVVNPSPGGVGTINAQFILAVHHVWLEFRDFVLRADASMIYMSNDPDPYAGRGQSREKKKILGGKQQLRKKNTPYFKMITGGANKLNDRQFKIVYRACVICYVVKTCLEYLFSDKPRLRTNILDLFTYVLPGMDIIINSIIGGDPASFVPRAQIYANLALLANFNTLIPVAFCRKLFDNMPITARLKHTAGALARGIILNTDVNDHLFSNLLIFIRGNLSKLEYLEIEDTDYDITSGYKEKDDAKLQTIEIPQNIHDQISDLRNIRYNTVLIRNLIFVINAYRTVREGLQRNLTYNKDIIAKSEAASASRITEFIGNQIARNRPRSN